MTSSGNFSWLPVVPFCSGGACGVEENEGELEVMKPAEERTSTMCVILLLSLDPLATKIKCLNNEAQSEYQKRDL